MGSRNSAQRGSGIFDVRNIIAALLGIYGLVLLVLGIVDFTAEEAQKAGGINANLYTGIGMVVVAALMMLWSLLAPIVPTQSSTPDDLEKDGETPGAGDRG